MGLSASQARLLNLTARMHDIEYKAQNLEAQKLQMSNESAHVYQEYENALNKQKIQFKNIGPDGNANFANASISTLLDNGYRIQILNGNVWHRFNACYSNQLGTLGTETSITTTGTTPVGNFVTVGSSPTKIYKVTKVNSSGVPTHGQEFTATTDAKLLEINTSDVKTLTNLVEAGFIVFEKPTTEKDSAGNIIYAEVNTATDTNLQEVSDEVELKKAEAKYEADMRKINQKDKKFDTDLAALEQERTAIKTEMDTLKSVAKDNVDRTYKLFS